MCSCYWAMGLKPQPDDSQQRYCMLGPHSWTHDGGTPRTCNESCESFHCCLTSHFLYFSAQRCPVTTPVPPSFFSFILHLCVVWAGRTFVAGKNLDLDHHIEIHHGEPALAWSERLSVIIFHEVTAKLCHKERGVLIIIVENAV